MDTNIVQNQRQVHSPRPEIADRSQGVDRPLNLSHRVRPALNNDYRLPEHRMTTQRSGTAPPGQIELHIGELALHGFDHVDPTRLGVIVQQELSRLLSANGTPTSLNYDSSLTHLEGEAFTAQPGMKSEALGAQIARAIYRGLEQ